MSYSFLYEKLKLGTSSEFFNLFLHFTDESFLGVPYFKVQGFNTILNIFLLLKTK